MIAVVQHLLEAYLVVGVENALRRDFSAGAINDRHLIAALSDLDEQPNRRVLPWSYVNGRAIGRRNQRLHAIAVGDRDFQLAIERFGTAMHGDFQRRPMPELVEAIEADSHRRDLGWSRTLSA